MLASQKKTSNDTNSEPCIFTVLTLNPEYLAYIEEYLQNNFDYTKTAENKFMLTAQKNSFSLLKGIEELGEYLSRDSIYSPVSDFFKISKFLQKFTTAFTNKTMVSIEINPLFVEKSAEFENLLNNNNILFYKEHNKYFINSMALNETLFVPLKSAGFLHFMFNISGKHSQSLADCKQKFNHNLEPSEPLVIIELSLPQSLQSIFRDKFNLVFGDDCNSVLAEKYLIVPANSIQKYKSILKGILQEVGRHALHAEYFKTDNSDFQKLTDQLGYRLKIIVSKDLNSVELSALLMGEHEQNDREERADEVVYWIDASTLSQKTLVFAAVGYNLTIEYFDPERKKYQSIENAERTPSPSTSEGSDYEMNKPGRFGR